MFGPLDAFAYLVAQAAPAAGKDPGLIQYLPLLPIPFIFYFLLLRPQQQQDKKRRQMIAAIKKNDKVLTAGGIYGTITSVDPANDRVVLRVDDEGRVKIPFTMASIVRVLEVSPDKGSPAS